MHHIAFSSHALHILISPHTYAFARSCFHGDEARNSEREYRGPQAPSVEMLTLLWSRQAHVYLITVLELCLSLYLIYDSWMCIRLYELNWYPNCIKMTFQSILVNPVARDRSLAMTRHRSRPRGGHRFIKLKLWFSW
jgi:hypothetical protein